MQSATDCNVRDSGFTGQLTLSPQSLRALEWWATSHPWERNGAPIVPEIRAIQCSVRSDAATETLGWGGDVVPRGQTTVNNQGFLYGQ